MSFGQDNFGLVEGAWGDFEFRKIQPQDWERVMEHIRRNFMRDEPTCKLLGYSDDFGEDFAALAHKMLGDDLSFLVEHRESGDIAGVRVTFRHYRSLSFEDIPVTSYAGKALMRLVDILEKMSNLYDAFGVEEYAEFFVASCDVKYRRRGITTEMYRRNLEFLRAEGFKLTKSIFTSPYTRAAVSKFGFVEVCRLDYHEFIDEEGQSVFNPDELSDEHFAAVMVKLL